jgi:hypothetical protein
VHSPPAPVADERGLELDRDRGVLAAVADPDRELAFAEVEHQAGADRHADDPFDRGAGGRQVAHHCVVAVIVVDHADAAEHAAALLTVDVGPLGSIFISPVSIRSVITSTGSAFE